MDKKIVYVDMDGVLVDFQGGVDKVDPELLEQHSRYLCDIPGVFSLMDPIPGAIESFEKLSETFDTYILSTAPWGNSSAWADKVDWVKRYMGDRAFKRLILTNHKNLNIGDYLIDDRERNGAEIFKGELILFGSEKYPNWDSVLEYLIKKS